MVYCRFFDKSDGRFSGRLKLGRSIPTSTLFSYDEKKYSGFVIHDVKLKLSILAP